MTDPTAPGRPQGGFRRAAGPIAATVALLVATGCTASNHMGIPSRADPRAGRPTSQQFFPAGMQTTAAGGMPAPQDPHSQDPPSQDPTSQDPTSQDPTSQDPTGSDPAEWTAANQDPPAAVAPSGFASATGCLLGLPDAGRQLAQTLCTTADGTRYAVTAFAAQGDQQRWLAAALGGSFLVGDRWAIGADAATLRSLQLSVGGTVTDAAGN